MYLAAAGNAYVHKERSGAGKIAELWLLRPDRVRVIPDATRHVSGYEYLLGDHRWILPAQDVMHLRTRSLTDDYYGLAPLAVVAGRVDIDNAMRLFTQAFFHNAAVPAGLLTITKQVTEAERQLIKSRFRQEYGGAANAHSLLVLDNADAKYTAMGLPLGDRGIALPTLDEINEIRIIRPFGVPPELVAARLSLRGQRSAAQEARRGFWDETLIPHYAMVAAQLQMAFRDEPVYGQGWDYLGFDLSTVQALQEDADALMKRAVSGYEAGVLQRGEARRLVGQEATQDDNVYFLPRSSGLVAPDEVLVPGAAAAELLPAAAAGVPAPGVVAPPSPNGKVSEWALEIKASQAGTGLIVCLSVPPRLAAALALPGGESPDALHCTLAFLHDSPPTRLIPRARAVVQAVAAQQPPLVGTVSGVGRFSGQLPGDPDAVYASVDVPGLAAFRTRLVAALAAASVRTQPAHDFTPHITLAYIPAHAPAPVSRLDPLTVTFDALDVWSGAGHASYPFQGAPALVAVNGVAHG
jgi:HK97 family phage portal protein